MIMFEQKIVPQGLRASSSGCSNHVSATPNGAAPRVSAGGSHSRLTVPETPLEVKVTAKPSATLGQVGRIIMDSRPSTQRLLLMILVSKARRKPVGVVFDRHLVNGRSSLGT